MYGAKTVRTWVPSAPPQNGAPDQQAATPAPGGCQHQQVLCLQHTPDDPLPHRALGHGPVQGRRWGSRSTLAW